MISEWPGGEYLDDLLLTGLPEPWTAATMIMVAAGTVASAMMLAGRHLCLTPHSLRRARRVLPLSGAEILALACR